jgi:hypothetical protein
MLNGNFRLNMYRGTARFGDDTARKRIYDYLTKLPGSVFAYDNKEVTGSIVADFATREERDEFLARFGRGTIVQTAKTAGHLAVAA